MGKGKAAAQVYFNLCPVRVWSVEDINAEVIINMTIPLQNKLMRLKFVYFGKVGDVTSNSLW